MTPDDSRTADPSAADPEAGIDVAARLAAARDDIAQAARAVGRDPADIALVAVSKKHDAGRIEAALAAGHRVFAENRVQEAQGKYPALKQRWPDLGLHLVGPLQTNKAEDAVALFDVIESLDRTRLATALAKAMDKTGRRPALYVQVNTGEESQKSGVAPEDADAFVRHCRDELGLPVTGVMCIPPHGEEPAPHFALLAEIAARNGLPAVSMGMSGDYQTAVKLGATHVRLGTAIFGARPG
jgi:hypothetical protein